ncbi:LysR family transcriptional regulator [Paraburkholderia caballeronis]|uniref:DNA-binding transcriptional regulator, LysR family n=1 Tax=Paraburkholderia caballeronis TaxID=416943 RepID=A0A1H7NXW7_9BURK|nr:LysR family transcriptional regulator [Paraburkholderia caballeronis]PXW25489.1 LysR family transcriptional regulator [Paraburkholderia caballeronis]PXX01096.1 LysR family transcriptional regulator [Paraburkholderia caballeronis]RAJ99551.1 LysR family transcriptional regulator [Paraburkholderia caballeronis]SEE35271.1 transcriptional regulator, LysR family [Paraburkholderia caballeronis]SEL28094.1 DNA-binding transcriptional regulator, LysR family [Paraburkholderia caballeronis]
MQKNTIRRQEALNWDDLRYFLEVARTQRASGAARRLGVDHTTVARRVRELETSLGTVLFDKSRSGGFVLTAEGQRLLAYADSVETTVQSASEQFAAGAQSLSGHVRVGSTEGFGCFFLAPQLARFTGRHPDMSIDLLPVPHFVSLSKREADLAIMLERPERGQYVYTKLCDYRLRLYGTPDYLAQHPPIRTSADLRHHAFLSYVADLAFSHELLYLERTAPNVTASLCSTSVIAQYHAALQGSALAILPCFMAEPDPRLVRILPDEVVVTRRFWLCSREDLRKLRRITSLWDYLRAAADANHALLMGESPQMQYVDA